MLACPTSRREFCDACVRPPKRGVWLSPHSCSTGGFGTPGDTHAHAHVWLARLKLLLPGPPPVRSLLPAAPPGAAGATSVGQQHGHLPAGRPCAVRGFNSLSAERSLREATENGSGAVDENRVFSSGAHARWRAHLPIRKDSILSTRFFDLLGSRKRKRAARSDAGEERGRQSALTTVLKEPLRWHPGPLPGRQPPPRRRHHALPLRLCFPSALAVALRVKNFILFSRVKAAFDSTAQAKNKRQHSQIPGA